jgi:membrane associated rhomboid family serine protease
VLGVGDKGCANPVRIGVEAASIVPDTNEIDDCSRNPQADTAVVPPLLNLPTLVVVLVGLLVAIHAIVGWMGENFEIWTIYAFSFIPQRLSHEAIAAPFGAAVWSFLTYALLHGSWFHLISNCLWLLVFATPVVRHLGTVRALALLTIAAVAGAAAMLPLHWGQFLIVIGASASVSGAMAAAMPVMYAPGFRRTMAEDDGTLRALRPGELLRNRNALVFTAVFFMLQLLTGTSQATTGTAFLNEGLIAWEAHLGGFVAGLLGFYLLVRKSASQA